MTVKRHLFKASGQALGFGGSGLGRTVVGAAWVVAAATGLGACDDHSSPGDSARADMRAEADMTVSDPPDLAPVDPINGLIPALTAIEPGLGPSTGGVTVTMTGMNFVGNTPKVSFAGVQASDVKVNAETQLVATLPAKPGAWGKVPVMISLSNGQSVTRSDLFGYYAGQVDFARPTGFDAGKEPVALATGDFNGDMKEDLAVASNGGDTVGLLLGKGDGTFQDVKAAMVGKEPIALRAADVNGDMKLDLVVANAYSGSVSVLLGKGDGTFDAAKNTNVPGRPTAVAIGDWNGDGKVDVAVASYDLGSVTILGGKGDGTFDPAATKTIKGFNKPVALSSGELSGDTKLDLVVANAGSGLSVLVGKGDLTFQDATQIAIGDSPLSVSLVDLNGDKKADLVAANSGGAAVAVALGNGDGTFGQPKSFSTARGPNTVITGDWNGDGKLDLAASCYDDAAVSVLLGKGDGTFPTEVRIPSLLTPYSVASRDWNGDGRPDLVVASSSLSRVQLLLNTSK